MLSPVCPTLSRHPSICLTRPDTLVLPRESRLGSRDSAGAGPILVLAKVLGAEGDRLRKFPGRGLFGADSHVSRYECASWELRPWLSPLDSVRRFDEIVRRGALSIRV